MSQIDKYICKIVTVCYRGITIWKLQSDEVFPWHAYIDGKNQDFNCLDDAKNAIDDFRVKNA